jgi:hypothetical protein
MGQCFDNEGNIHGVLGQDSSEVMRKMLELDKKIVRPNLGDIVKPVTIERVIIAPMPTPGDFLDVNGLKFRVTHKLSDDTYVIKFCESVKAEELK